MTPSSSTRRRSTGSSRRRLELGLSRALDIPSKIDPNAKDMTGELLV